MIEILTVVFKKVIKVFVDNRVDRLVVVVIFSFKEKVKVTISTINSYTIIVFLADCSESLAVVLFKVETVDFINVVSCVFI